MTGPRLAVVFAVAGVIGFGLGTWLGSATKPTVAAAVVATASSSTPVASPDSTSPLPTSSPEPTETVPPSAGPTATPEIIFSIRGTKHEVTDSFKAKPGWQIQWQIDGDAIAIAVSGDPNLGVVVDQKGPASGVTGVAQGGEFALNIVATGPWKITVIEGEDPAPS